MKPSNSTLRLPFLLGLLVLTTGECHAATTQNLRYLQRGSGGGPGVQPGQPGQTGQPSTAPTGFPVEAPTEQEEGCSTYTSPFNELQWETGCSNYDFYGTLYFCQDGDSYGYRLTDTEGCSTGLSPVVRMQAGYSYQLRLVNPSDNTASTNIHTHGLHIPGSGNTDDVTRHVDPGHALFYNWTIPEEHMDGTFFYHSHMHGETFDQVNGGAVGVLIIDPADSASDRAAWVENTNNDRILLLSSNVDGQTSTDYANGEQTAHSIAMNTNQWHRLRIVVADPESLTRDITFDSSICTAYIAAHDGVWRNTVPKAEAIDTISVSGANRIDIAIRCSESSGLWYRTDSTTSEDPFVVFDACSDGMEHGANLETWVPDRPSYLTDLSSATVDETFSIDSMSVATGINGYLWDEDTPLAYLTHDRTQEWTISATQTHPFHLHLYHFQIVTAGGCGAMFDEGEWFDSLSADFNTPCTVRFHTDGIGGRTVFHCHTLLHEDAGMMGWVDVDNAPSNGDTHVEQTDVVDSECYAV